MCQRVKCSSCGKPSDVGCGRHVEQVLGDVAPDARCACHEAKANEPAPLSSAAGRLFGR